MINKKQLQNNQRVTIYSLGKRLNEAISPKVHPQPPPAGDIVATFIIIFHTLNKKAPWIA
jgi:hypothetical protein